MRIRIIILFIVCITANSYGQYGFDTVRIYYDIGKSDWQKSSKPTLDSTIAKIKKNNTGILIYGYADYLGTEKPNQMLSDNRADKVKKYLLAKGIKSSLILTATGVGQKEEHIAGQHGNQQNRRTEIFIKRLNGDLPIAYTEHTSNKVLAETNPLKIDISQVQKDETFILKDINFYESTHRVVPESEPALKELLDVMRNNPNLKIQIEGHICCVTDYPDATDAETGNLDLSYQRAKFVRDYLVKNGIAPERLSYKGFGRKHPLVPFEATPEDAQRNRRVEIRILDK